MSSISMRTGRNVSTVIRPLLIPVLLTLLANHAWADTFEWTDPVNGTFSDASKWTNISGVELAPPNAGDRVDFNEAGAYEVAFTQNEASDILAVTAGDITFLSSSTALRTFTLATGSADANISGGTIQIGTDTNPLFLNLPNVSTGGGLNVSVMNIGSQADGAVTVTGSNSRLDVLGATNHSLGLSGNDGVLNVLNNATANFGVNGTLNVGDSSNSGSQGVVTVDTGGTLNTGNIDIAPQTSGATGMVSVSGSGATIRQTLAGATLNVGSSSGGAGTIRIENGAAFETGGGLTTFLSTGTLDMNGGTFTVNGPMAIDGGTILAGASSGGPNQVDLIGPVTVSAVNDAQVFLPLVVDGNSIVNVSTGADLFGFSAEVGSGSTGTVVVDGGGSTFDGFSLKIGTQGGQGLVTFQNSAEAGIFSFGGARLDIAVDSSQQSIGELNVLSGSLVSTDQLRLATQATTGSSASLVVDGASSTMQSGSVSVGHASSGAATIEVRNGGTLLLDRFSRTVSVFETGRVDVGLVGSGTLTAATVAVNGGTLNFGAQGLLNLDAGGLLVAGGGGRVDMAAAFVIEDAETFDISGGAAFAVQDDLDVGGVGSGTLTIGDSGSTVEVGGTLKVANTGSVTLDGGNIVTDTFDNVSGGTFDFIAGALTINTGIDIGAGMAFPNSVSLNSDQALVTPATTTIAPFRTLSLDGGTLETGNLEVHGAFNFKSGELVVTGANGLTIGATGPFGDALTVKDSQEISVSNTTTIDVGATLQVQTAGVIASATLANKGQLSGTGRIQATLANDTTGEVFVGVGEQLRVLGSGHTNTGQFTLGSGTLNFDGDVTNEASGLIIGTGTYRVDGGTTNSGMMALSATSNVIGDLTNNAGAQITVSGGTTSFFDDVVNNGEIRTATGSSSVHFGSYSGNGDTGAGTVIMVGDLKPGSSPGIMAFAGNLFFSPEARLEIEIGGLVAGSEYDQVSVANAASLNGSLGISLTDSFSLNPGQLFEIVNVGGSTSGTFSGLAEGGIAGNFDGVNLLITYAGGDGNDVTLLAVLPGDNDLDGDVDGFDFVLWQRGESPHPLSQSDLADWQQNYGTIVSPSAATSTIVPEPTSAVLLILSTVAAWLRSRKST